MEYVERWAEFVRNNHRNKWKRALNIFIDAQYDKAIKFYKNLEKTEEGRKVLERLRAEKKKGYSGD